MVNGKRLSHYSMNFIVCRLSESFVLAKKTIPLVLLSYPLCVLDRVQRCVRKAQLYDDKIFIINSNFRMK